MCLCPNTSQILTAFNCFPHFNLEPQVLLKKSKCKQESFPANPNTQAVERPKKVPYNFTGVC